MPAPERKDIWMERDDRDVWPDADIQPGKFDITEGRAEGYANTARITFVCPFGRVCSLLLAPQPIPRTDDSRLFVWGWNGHPDKPSLTPSINCESEKDGKPTGGCGWHGFIRDGVMR